MKEYVTKHEVMKFEVETTNGNVYNKECMKDVVGKKGKLIKGVFFHNEDIPLNKIIGKFSINDDLTVKFTVLNDNYPEIIESLKDKTFEDKYRIVLSTNGEVIKIDGLNIVTKIFSIDSANLILKKDSSWEKKL